MASSASAGRIGGDRAPFQTWHRPETSPLPLPAIPAAPQRLPATRFLVPPAGVGGNPTSPNLYVNAAKPRKPWLPGVCKPPGRGGAGRGSARHVERADATVRPSLERGAPQLVRRRCFFVRARPPAGAEARAATAAWRGSGCVYLHARARVVPAGRTGGF